MAKVKTEKTNVMRVLDSKKVKYTEYTYPADPVPSGVEVAAMLGKNPSELYKTLVTRGKSGQYYVFDIAAPCELDLKKAASAVGEKSIEMVKSKELLPLTGYIHGGCSPIGMKKLFKTTFDIECKELEHVIISGGKIGFMVEVSLDDLTRVIPVSFASLTKTDGED